MLSFNDAIHVATKNAKSLIKDAKNFTLEGVLISNDDKLYEVDLNYDLQGRDPFDLQGENNAAVNTSLLQLSQIMRYRKAYKTFLVDKASGKFRGFTNQNNH